MSQDAVTVWQWDLDQEGPGDRAVLSPEERARADRFIVPHAARRFTTGRAALRRTLGALCGVPAASLGLATGPNGKPYLPGGPEFNLSHSGPVALFVVAKFPVGIDVEAYRPLEHGLAPLVFTTAERAYLASLSKPERETAVVRGWTRKEAVIKAQGGSIADLQAITVLPDPILPGWQVVDLPFPPGHAASVAAARQGWRVILQDR